MSLFDRKGAYGEQLALRHLEQQGLKLIKKNYLCKLGEIDLVMKDHETLVFVEVKARSSLRFGSPLQFISISKQQKIVKATQHYLRTHKISSNIPLRFDAVGVLTVKHEEPVLEWVQNAFYG